MVDMSNQPSDFTFAVVKPLSIVEDTDGKKWIAYIEGREVYGFVADDDSLMMCNAPEDSNNGIQGIRYRLKDIESVRTGDVGCVKVTMTGGEEYTHRCDPSGLRRINIKKSTDGANEYTIIEDRPIYTDMIAADDSSLWNTERVFK